jgi:hypothetical protein
MNSLTLFHFTSLDLLLTFQDKQSLLLIFALEQILLPLNTLTLTLQSPKLTLSELPVKIQMATCRLREIETDRSTYVEQFESFISQAGFPTLGRDVNYSDVHKDVVVKYIQSLCKNMDKRFGDSVGQISVAATIFKPDSVEMSLEDQLEKVGVLADHFKLNKDSAANEWLCFRRYMDHRKNKNGADIFNSLLVSDLSDAFPELAKLAGIIMVSPIGTAGVERSFSTMSRLCNKLRQRLTPQHLSQLLLVSQEGPEAEHITRQELSEIVYLWYSQGARRIQLPPRVT